MIRHPILMIKEIIDSVRNPEGDVEAAVEITDANAQMITEILGPDNPFMNEAPIGDFMVIFKDRKELYSICPSKYFHKHYEFVLPMEPPETMTMTKVRPIKPL